MEKDALLFLKFKKFSLIASIITLCISVAVLIGWFFEIETLKSVTPYFVAMKFNTALSIFCASLGLLLLQESGIIKKWRRAVGVILGSFVLSVGAITLYEIVAEVNVGIDQFFYTQQPGAIYTPYLGRMAPVTTIIFILTGLSIILLALNIRQKLLQIAAFIAFIISLFSLLGYIFNLQQIIGITAQQWITPIALHTSIAFIILMLGILFARPDQGFVLYIAGDALSASFIRRAFPLITAFVILYGYFILYGERQGFYLGEMGLTFQIIIDLTIFYVVGIWIASETFGIEADQKRLVEKQKEEKDKVDTLLQSIGDAVIAIDSRWNIILWNKSAQSLLGLGEQDVIGQPFRKFVKIIDEHSRAENVHFIEECLLSSQRAVIPSSVSLVTKNDIDIPISGVASQIKSLNNGAAGAIIILHDETKERAALSVHSSFAYASHQLRTPVNKAMWVLESMTGACKNKKIQDGISEAYNALKSVHKLSEQIVVASEIDQGMIVPKNEAIKLSSLWSLIQKATKKDADEKNIKLVFVPFSKSAIIKTSVNLLSAILAEIVENSINYSRANSEVKIVVRVSDNSLLFEIHDSGIGIEEDQQALVFTKFFRGSNFKTSKIAGSGLGLYIAREYTKLLNGKIWFSSHPNVETVFYVSIPILP